MRLLLMLVVLPMCAATPLAAQEAVTLGRYRVTLSAGSSATVSAVLDLARLNERCRDVDGCEVSLQMESVGLDAAGGRVYMGLSNPARWVGVDEAEHVDTDGGPDSAITVGSTPSCVFSDGDGNPAIDSIIGFSLKLTTGSAAAACTLTVMD